MEQREIEELLELIWTLKEDNKNELKLILDLTNEKNPELILKEMVKRQLIKKGKNEVNLTPEGEKYAEKIIRRHRLAERLFKDVFQMTESSFEKEACTWEHVLSEEVTDSVCTFLGHPRVCPHQKPIPRGKCCRKFSRPATPLVQPLSDVEVGVGVKITYILPSFKKRLEKLTNFGVIPGNFIKIKQKSPALVVQIEETTIALDKKVAKEIFVIKRNS